MGFQLALPRARLVTAHSVSVVAVTADGTASVIPFATAAQAVGTAAGSNDTLRQVVLPDESVAAIRGSTIGSVDSVVVSPHTIEVNLPSGMTWADYRWVEIDTRSGFRADSFALSDRLSFDLGRQITFQTMDTSPTRYRVQVGSCAQWHGYGARPLFLTFQSAQDITSIKLYP